MYKVKVAREHSERLSKYRMDGWFLQLFSTPHTHTHQKNTLKLLSRLTRTVIQSQLKGRHQQLPGFKIRSGGRTKMGKVTMFYKLFWTMNAFVEQIQPWRTLSLKPVFHFQFHAVSEFTYSPWTTFAEMLFVPPTLGGKKKELCGLTHYLLCHYFCTLLASKKIFLSFSFKNSSLSMFFSSPFIFPSWSSEANNFHFST